MCALNLIQPEIDRLTREYKADLQKGDLKNAISKLYTVLGLPQEAFQPLNEALLQELRTIQETFHQQNPKICEKALNKNQKAIQKIRAEWEDAVTGKKNFGKAEKSNTQLTKLLEKSFLYVEALEARKKHMDYRKISLGLPMDFKVD